MTTYTFPFADVRIAKFRQRRIITTKALRELADDIAQRGNLSEPGVWFDDDSVPHLVWGERRFRAIELLASEGKTYRTSSGVEVPLGMIVVKEFSAESLVDLKEAEYAENTVREDLVWADRVRALDEIHSLRQAANPNQTIQQTAREISAKTGVPVASLNKPPNLANPADVNSNSLPAAVFVAPHLHNPQVLAAKTLGAALAVVTKLEEDKAVAALIAKRKARGALTGQLIELRHGDAKLLVKDVPDASVDLILFDPPYGKNANADAFSKKQGHAHDYADDPRSAREFMQQMFLEGFRIAKPRANLLMFFDLDFYEWIVATAQRAAWSPFPTPLVWNKMSPGLGPWQGNGPGRQFELIFFATKGQRGFHSCNWGDVLDEKRVGTEQRIHAAEKPIPLLRKLISAACFPGEFVLDPCVGSGATLEAARLQQCRGLGFEQNRAYYDAANARLFGKEGVTI